MDLCQARFPFSKDSSTTLDPFSFSSSFPNRSSFFPTAFPALLPGRTGLRFVVTYCAQHGQRRLHTWAHVTCTPGNSYRKNQRGSPPNKTQTYILTCRWTAPRNGRRAGFQPSALEETVELCVVVDSRRTFLCEHVHLKVVLRYSFLSSDQCHW